MPALATRVGGHADDPQDVLLSAAVATRGKAARHVVVYSAVGLTLLLVSFFLRETVWRGSSGLHNVMEAMATLVAVMVGVMALVRYYSRKDLSLLIISAGFLGTAFLDGYHGLVTSSLLAGLMPSGLDSLLPWSWIASRLFLSVFLFASIAVRFGQNTAIGDTGRDERAVYTFTACFAVLTVLFFTFVPLPAAQYQDFIFHRPAEFLPGLIFLAALIGYLHKGDWRDDPMDHWLVLSLIVSVIGQVAFMPISNQVFDASFDASHVLKLVSYLCVLVGLLVSMYSLFRKVQLHEKDLLSVNKTLAAEIIVREEAQDDLATRNEELMQFAYSASHDLKGPLISIRGLLQICEDDMDDGELDEVRQNLSKAIALSMRSEAQVESVLELARVGHDVFESKPVSFETVVNEVWQGLTSGKKLMPDFSYRPGHTDPIVLEDPTIRLVMQNLLANAIRYRDDEKQRTTIDIVTSMVDGLFQVDVSDNGLGIQAPQQHLVFEMFKRVDEKSENGLGLPLVKKHLERLGGSLTFISTEGEGTRFSFTIPIKDPIAAPTSSVPRPQ